MNNFTVNNFTVNNTTHAVEYLVLGAGPAGLQLGYFLGKKGADYCILEAGDRAATNFEQFPRHRTLISINKRFTRSEDPEFKMRHDWNSLLTEQLDFTFRDYDPNFFPSAENLLRYMNDFAARFELNITYGCRATRVSKSAEGYLVECANGACYQAKVLVIATGFSKPYLPDIDGIEHTENYVDMSIDTKRYEGKRVLIIGKGNSGFETADHLVNSAALIHVVSPRSIRMAWKTHYVGDLRAVNNNILDTYQLKSENAILDAEVKKIEPIDDGYRVSFLYAHANGELETIDYDYVLCCTGFRIDDSIFDDSAKPKLTIKGKYPELTAEFESVNRAGLFFAGTLTHSLDYRKATSGFIHGFRYNAKALCDILACKYANAALSFETFDFDIDAVVAKLLDRVNRSGGIWQQPGFFADCFLVQDDRVRYYRELPFEYLRQATAAHDGYVFLLTLEYGHEIVGDPFCVERVHRDDVDHAKHSQFLHPVVRYYHYGEYIGDHHVIEDLEANWVEAVHYEPLRAFLRSVLDPSQAGSGTGLAKDKHASTKARAAVAASAA